MQHRGRVVSRPFSSSRRRVKVDLITLHSRVSESRPCIHAVAKKPRTTVTENVTPLPTVVVKRGSIVKILSSRGSATLASPLASYEALGHVPFIDFQ